MGSGVKVGLGGCGPTSSGNPKKEFGLEALSGCCMGVVMSRFFYKVNSMVFYLTTRDLIVVLACWSEVHNLDHFGLSCQPFSGGASCLGNQEALPPELGAGSEQGSALFVLPNRWGCCSQGFMVTKTPTNVGVPFSCW